MVILHPPATGTRSSIMKDIILSISRNMFLKEIGLKIFNLKKRLFSHFLPQTNGASELERIAIIL